ncbi:MAG: hypothetical protein GX340_00300 [Clostridiales bacterium]|nr:hypothetical protein [Clostridiales bacterium]
MKEIKVMGNLPELSLPDIVAYLGNCDNINQLPTIEDIFGHLDKHFKTNGMEVFYDNVYEGIDFVIKDGTKCCLSNYGTCILHPYQSHVDDEGSFVYEINDSDLYVCASCKTLLQSRTDILEAYDDYFMGDYSILFPKKWTDEGIHAWCRKRIQNQLDDKKNRKLKEMERNSLNADCSNCTHIKHGECEYGLDSMDDDDYFINCGCHEYR